MGTLPLHLHVAGLLDRCTYTLYTYQLPSLLVTLSPFPPYTHTNILNYRVKAYIRNGWANNIIDPHSFTTNNNATTDDLQPTDGWKSIRSASEVPNFSTSNIITYFVTRTAADGLAVGDFKSANKAAENLFLCGHVQDIEISTKPDILWVRAKCLPEMRKDKLYKVIASLSPVNCDILTSQCGCPAGVGPQATCKHIGALCYALANCCYCGQIPDFVTSTERLQEWNRPRARRLETMPVSELGARRQVILKKKKYSKAHTKFI